MSNRWWQIFTMVFQQLIRIVVTVSGISSGWSSMQSSPSITKYCGWQPRSRWWVWGQCAAAQNSEEMIKCLQPQRQRCSPTNSCETLTCHLVPIWRIFLDLIPYLGKGNVSLTKKAIKAKSSHCPEYMLYICNPGWWNKLSYFTD